MKTTKRNKPVGPILDVQGFAERLGMSAPDIAVLTQELLDAITSNLEKASVVSDEIVALCPFHQDKTVGSFYLNKDSGLYICWSCGAKGGIGSLAYRFNLAPRGYFKGVDLKRLSLSLVASNQKEVAPRVEDLPALPESVLDHMEDVEDFRGHWSHTLRRLEVKYDPHYDRIAFPVRRYDGDLVGIQSRSMRRIEHIGRWKFYKAEFSKIGTWDEETILTLLSYEVPRSSCFYGETVSWPWFTSGGKEPLIICEGPGHLLRVLEAGYLGLATFGTFMSQRQVNRIKEALGSKEEPHIVLCYDSDPAGRRATRQIGLQLYPHCRVEVAELPEGKDPEDLNVKDLKEVLENPIPFLTSFIK